MIILINILFISLCFSTFSIIAVDENTNEVGSAGGSCIANSIIISDIHPGVGAIHTQSYWNSSNQIYASDLMEQGFSPSEIMELLENNDIQNNPGIRQYGAVDLFRENNYGYLYENECNEIEGAQWYGQINGQIGLCADPPIGRSASFTGESCLNWKGHINGINYAIQGNILLNESVIDNIEEAFLSENGSLDQKLMAALQGGKIPGADSRCLDEGISTLSAFIRVAKDSDEDNYYMDLNINSVIPYYNSYGVWIDPIDTLQILYDEWYVNEFEYDLGDINQDFIINILDVVQLVNVILSQNFNGIEYFLSDINNDDIINIQDIILIINLILN